MNPLNPMKNAIDLARCNNDPLWMVKKHSDELLFHKTAVFTNDERLLYQYREEVRIKTLTAGSEVPYWG